MKSGFELFRKADSSKPSRIMELETLYNIKLPSSYRLFCGLFELGKFRYEMYTENGDVNNLSYCSQIYYKPKGLGENNIGITGIDDIDSVFEKRKNLIGYGQGDTERELLRIADIGRGGGIFVGIGKNNLDDIILHVWDEDPGYEKLADNIWEFISDIVLEPLSEDEYPEIAYSRLYKNWGEDFWRIRENNF